MSLAIYTLSLLIPLPNSLGTEKLAFNPTLSKDNFLILKGGLASFYKCLCLYLTVLFQGTPVNSWQTVKATNKTH